MEIGASLTVSCCHCRYCHCLWHHGKGMSTFNAADCLILTVLHEGGNIESTIEFPKQAVTLLPRYSNNLAAHLQGK